MKDEANKLDVNMIWEDNPEGCILEVDLDYPEDLHDLHNTYPLAPEKIEMNENKLSD